MHPTVPRKRLRDKADEESPAHAPLAKRGRVAKGKAAAKPKGKPVKGKASLFDAVDSPERPKRTLEENKRFLEQQEREEHEDGEDESEEEDDDFEDVPGIATASRHAYGKRSHHNRTNGEDEDSSTDENEMDWEDAIPSASHHRSAHHGHSDGPDTPINDVSITLPTPGTAIPTNNLALSDARGVVGKKGPSKIERQIRQNTHCLHVLFLMYHNLIRNTWLQDEEVQSILVGQLPDALQDELERWKRKCAIGQYISDQGAKKSSAANGGSKASKGKGRATSKSKADGEQESRDRMRDWGADAERLESGTPDLSHGDPTIRLLRYFAAYWQKRFRITAPSLQKQGYLPPAELEAEVKGWLKDGNDAEQFGEKVRNVEELRIAAKKCEGSRDVGAQLFTALMRGVGLDARMVASLQPVGFGFGKVEEGSPQKTRARGTAQDELVETEEGGFTKPKGIDKRKARTPQQLRKVTPKQSRKVPPKPARKSARGATKAAAISLDTSDSDELSDAPSDMSIDSSIINVTPSKSSKKPMKAQPARPCATYWTEVLSAVTNTFIPVVSLPTALIANSLDLLAPFTPTGRAADEAKQVLAYVVAFSADNTAKDVTVRYLKKKLWPGKTRGVRVAKEKVPIYNKRGKVKKYIEWDWFDQVMSGYAKDPRKRTEAEEMEDEIDLVPVAATKKETDAEDGNGKVGGKPESLAAYKNSAEYVLERHLRREEAILPDATPVRQFTVGKGDKATTEPVFRRADVVACKTVESWHKEGRAVKNREQPLKLVPVRAVTLIRKREAEDIARETGEKPTQGLYSESQTDWIIPDPIGPDRSIPRNAFGNIDIYVRTMVPAGAVHVRLKGTAKLCKKLGIDFAEACTGFEFGKQRAVPVLTGVVVAEENEELVKDAWRAEQERVKERDNKKRQAAALMMWKRFMQGLRIMERMRGEYGRGEKVQDESNPWVSKKVRDAEARKEKDVDALQSTAQQGHGDTDVHTPEDDNLGGGFFAEGYNVEEVRAKRLERFDNANDGDLGGGFIVDDAEHDGDSGMQEPNAVNGTTTQTPTSLQSAHRARARKSPDPKDIIWLDGVMDEDEEVGDEPVSKHPSRGKATSAEPVRARKPNDKPAVNGTKGDDLINGTDSSSVLSEASDSDLGDTEESDNSTDERSESESSFTESKVSAKKSKTTNAPPVRASARKSDTGPKPAKAATRAAPKRNSTVGFRSRYFENDSDDSDE